MHQLREILEERETATDILTEDENYILARVGEVPDGVWAVLWNEDETSIVGDGYMTYVYDALAKKPHVHVYNHRQRLVEKKDYSLSYKNNTKAYNERNNAGELIVDAGKTPTVILSTKGNFVGKESLYFSIEPASFADYNDRIRSAGEVSYKHDSGKKVKVTIPVSFESDSGKRLHPRGGKHRGRVRRGGPGGEVGRVLHSG